MSRYGCCAVALVAVLALSGPVAAGDPAPYPDFTFKREKPPEPGVSRRITVQIDPEEQARTLSKPATADPASAVAVAPAGARYGWFWSRVPADAAQDPPARLRMAFEALDKGPDGAQVAGPRLQLLRSIAAREGANILRATIGTDVSPALVLAVIAVESGGDATAASDKGAEGLMQLMPDTAARFGVADRLSSTDNIRGGVAYLDWLLKEFGGDAVLALAGYNAGEGAVRAHGGVPPFAETRSYVPRVLAAYRVARNLCKTRPELITDACALDLAMK